MASRDEDSADAGDARRSMDYRRRRPAQVPRKGLPHGFKVYLWACVIAALLLLVAKALGGALPA